MKIYLHINSIYACTFLWKIYLHCILSYDFYRFAFFGIRTSVFAIRIWMLCPFTHLTDNIHWPDYRSERYLEKFNRKFSVFSHMKIRYFFIVRLGGKNCVFNTQKYLKGRKSQYNRSYIYEIVLQYILFLIIFKIMFSHTFTNS